MDKVSIILSTRHIIGSNDLEIIGECEKEYNQLALYALSGDIINMAKKCEGRLIPWVREKGLKQFCLAFRFETEEKKKEFLSKLWKLS